VIGAGAPLDRAEYEKLDRAEDRMWWFAAVHANLLMAYRGMTATVLPAEPILDAGCGTGGFLAKIAAEFPGGCAIGIDADREACVRAAAKSARPVCNGSVNALPFADGAFAAIFSADVLCHRDVDERAALAHFHRCLARGGHLILNLPAYPWMLSRHDLAVYNIRRYTRQHIAGLLNAAGFRVLYLSYWNTLLFPIMVLSRKLLPSSGTSDVMVYPRLVEAFCRAATTLESALLRRGVRLPFGGSLIAVAAKAPLPGGTDA
jgi:SAM-dependent methyltransferase